MNIRILSMIIIFFISIEFQANYDYTKLTYSQIGYDAKLSKQAMIQHIDSLFLDASTTFSLHRLDNNKIVYTNKIISKGKKWNKYWWEADFSKVREPGKYCIKINNGNKPICKSNTDLPIVIDDNLLWNKTWYATAIEHLQIRDSLSYEPEGGWKDCGSTLQELSSHVIMLNALCDLIELTPYKLDEFQIKETFKQIIVGADYITKCQDKATSIGFKEGAVVHEIRENYKVVTGNVAKTAMILARISRIVRQQYPEKSLDYRVRSVKAYNWIEEFGPVLHWERTNSFSITHGAPPEMFRPPNEWMTRDLVMMMWASLELYKCGNHEYKEKACEYARRIMKRQVEKENSEEVFFGHFYTYDSFDFTEKANIHCGAWDTNYKAYNQGGHFPHYLLPMIEMIKIWPEDKDVVKWNETVYNFAYHYFLPACNYNPFKILPAGYYKNVGLLNWSGWYHGHNKIFGYAAALASEFYNLYNDEQFLEIATRNLQWIAGLHSGFHKNDKYFSASMIVGIGNVYKEDWDSMKGTIINGFDAYEQFKLAKPSKETDMPSYYGDEGGIHHTAGWISGLAHLQAIIEKI